MLKRFLTAKRVAIGAYLAIGAFLLAHTVNAFVADALQPPPIQVSALNSITPSEHQAVSSRALADVIVASGLFPLPPGMGDSSASGQATEAPAPPLEVAKKVALIGTVFGQQGGIMAILEDLPTKIQSLYRMGEEIPAVGALSAIEKDRVLFRKGKQEEWLDLMITKANKGVTPLVASGNRVTQTIKQETAPVKRILDRRYIAELTADLPRILTHFTAAPNLTDGKIDGYRLQSVLPLGFFDKIGLQTNDVLQRINGVEIRDPAALMSFLQQLKNERSVRFDLRRNEEPQTLTYEIR
jgi:general secretion pathway protein C